MNVTVNPTATGDGDARRINLRPNVTAKNPGLFNFNPNSLNWRAAYWWTICAWLIFSFTQSMIGMWVAGAILGLPLPIRLILGVGVSAAEGILVAWCMCPSRGLVTKQQENYLKKGSYLIVFFQVVEIVSTYAQQITGDRSLLILMIAAAALMAATALITAHLVIDKEEARIVNLEAADVRIETAVNGAKLKKMRSRQFLDNQRSLIQVENRVRDQEKGRVLKALASRENQQAIDGIGSARARVVIEAYKRRIASYSTKILGAPKPASPGK